MAFLTRFRDPLLSLLRVMSGLLILEHGTSKYLDFPHSQYSGVAPLSLDGAAGALELIGGFLLVIGLFTRPVAFLLSGMMAVAYFLVHAPKDFFPLLNGGQLAVLLCFVFLYLAAAGGGPWSVDRLLARRG